MLGDMGLPVLSFWPSLTPANGQRNNTLCLYLCVHLIVGVLHSCLSIRISRSVLIPRVAALSLNGNQEGLKVSFWCLLIWHWTSSTTDVLLTTYCLFSTWRFYPYLARTCITLLALTTRPLLPSFGGVVKMYALLFSERRHE